MPLEQLLITPADKRKLHRRLLAWFAHAGRDFPWRERLIHAPSTPLSSHQRDPYRVWVSEIMLQQTTTETVRPCYERFLARFPNLASLAAASNEELLFYWQGLGYYRRATALHRAAQEVISQLGGKIPNELERLRALPGVGRYTAGAIRSFAFDLPAPILEANTRRLYTRLIALGAESEFSSPSSDDALLWLFAEQIIPQKHCGDFNQALTDLGSLVCRTVPHCEQCPLASLCRAHRLGLAAHLPRPVPKPTILYRAETALLIPLKCSGVPRYLFVRYPAHRTWSGRWGGLWDFPRFERTGDGPPEADVGLRTLLSDLFGTALCLAPARMHLRHSVTRYKIDLDFCELLPQSGEDRAFPKSFFSPRITEIPFAAGRVAVDDLEHAWLTHQEADSLALNTTARKLLASLGSRQL